MNKFKRKEKMDENIVTQNSTSTDFTKKNKMLFYKTISSNFSNEPFKNQKSKNKETKQIGFNSVKKFSKKKKIDSPLTKFKSIIEKTPNEKRRKSIVTIHDTPNKENEKKIESIPIINSLLPTNINSYQHLIRDRSFGIYDNLNWALRLRDYSHKGLNQAKVIDYKDYYYRENIKTNAIKQERIKLTEDFNPPSYYEEDLNKYKKKRQIESRSLITQLNPNYNKIRHLLFGNNQGKVNFSQFNFETTLRNLKYIRNNNENKKWEILPVVRTSKKIAKFLAPVTPNGIQHFKNIEKFVHKNYEYNIKDETYENDRIKRKYIYNNRNYTVSGIGETLGDEKYNNHFGDNNMFANKRILSTESNPQCKFELGLRIYGPYQDKKYLTQQNFRPKNKNIKKGK
jgi:hypothetical protein